MPSLAPPRGSPSLNLTLSLCHLSSHPLSSSLPVFLIEILFFLFFFIHSFFPELKYVTSLENAETEIHGAYLDPKITGICSINLSRTDGSPYLFFLSFVTPSPTALLMAVQIFSTLDSRGAAPLIGQVQIPGTDRIRKYWIG